MWNSYTIIEKPLRRRRPSANGTCVPRGRAASTYTLRSARVYTYTRHVRVRPGPDSRKQTNPWFITPAPRKYTRDNISLGPVVEREQAHSFRTRVPFPFSRYFTPNSPVAPATVLFLLSPSLSLPFFISSPPSDRERWRTERERVRRREDRSSLWSS